MPDDGADVLPSRVVSASRSIAEEIQYEDDFESSDDDDDDDDDERSVSVQVAVSQY